MGRMLKNMVSFPLMTFFDANAASAFAASSSNVRSPSLTVVVLDIVCVVGVYFVVCLAGWKGCLFGVFFGS